MFSIQDLLARRSIPGLKQSEDRRVIAETVTQVLGVEIIPKAIQVREGILSLGVPPVIKSAAAMKQEEIKERLRERGIEITTIR